MIRKIAIKASKQEAQKVYEAVYEHFGNKLWLKMEEGFYEIYITDKVSKEEFEAIKYFVQGVRFTLNHDFTMEFENETE